MRLRLPAFLAAATSNVSIRLRSLALGAPLSFSHWPRWARLATLLLSVWISCLLVLNVALNLGVSRPIFTRFISLSPRSLSVDYRRAWSFWPSLVYVRNARITGSDANVQWQLEVDEARVSIDLYALFKREFHVTKLRASGIGVRLRQRLDARAATDDRVAALPPLPNFPGPPLLEAGPPEPDIPDDDYDLWSIRVENVEGGAREVWIDEFHFQGEVQVAGAFFLRPKRWLWVGPAKATVAAGTVVIGVEPLLEGTSGRVNCTIPPFDPRPPVGREMFRFVSGDVQLDADLPGARALDYYTRIRGNPLHFDGGSGVFQMEGTLHSGVAGPLSVSLDMREFRAETPVWHAVASLGVVANADREGPGSWRARLTRLELRRAGAKSPAIVAPELRLDALTHEIDVSQPAPDFELRGTLPSASVPDLRLVNEFMSRTNKLRVDGGTAVLSAHFAGDTITKRAQGELAASAEQLSAHDGALYVHGRLRSKAQLSSVFLDSGDVDVSSAFIDARDVTLRESNTALSKWWGRVETHHATFRPAARVPVDMTFAASLQNAAPLLAFSKRSPSLPGWITRLLAGGKVAASGRLRAGAEYLELSNLKASTALLSVEGDLRQKGRATSGVFRFSAGPLSVGVELHNDEMTLVLVGSPVEPKLTLPAKDLIRHEPEPGISGGAI